MMKKFLSILYILIAITAVTHAERSVTGFNDMKQYREIGDYRLWTFIAKDSTIGTLTSTVKEQVSINDVDGYAIEQHLKLNFAKISTNLNFDITNRHFVADNGMYLGDNMKLTINDQTAEINLKRNKNRLQGFITRNGAKIEQNIELGNIKFAFESNYIDQLELLLASLDLTVGTQIDDTIFMTQSLIKAQIYGVVDDFRNIRLYNEVFDSAFVIEFTYPTMMTAFFTPDKRLAKLIIPSQELKIYQDAVANPLKRKLAAQKAAEQSKAKPTQLGAKKSLSKLFVVFFLYTAIGILVTLFLKKSWYKQSMSYVVFAIGGCLYLVIPITQIPLQEYLFTEYFVPHVLDAGESALLWGILPAITAGIIQEVLKCLGIVLLFNFLATKKKMYIVRGAIIGFGFGLVEAAYLASGTPTSLLFGVNLVERIFLLIFHIAAGAFIAYALKDGLKKLVPYILLTICINSIFRYLPIFAQNKTLTPELLGILLALISVSMLTLTVFLTKQKN